MFTILNRLRGMNGVWSKFNGLLLALIVQIAFDNPYVSIAVGLGYIIGESFGWGEWIGNLTTHRKNKTDTLEDEGENNGIKYIATKLVPNWNVAFIKYCSVALGIRGIYWWLPTLAPLYFVGFSVVSITVAVAVLSIGFPIACELGRLTAPLFSFEYKTFSIKGGWEHSEVWYGLMQDLVLITYIVWYYINF